MVRFQPKTKADMFLSQLFIMAYYAGVPEEPSALVHSISSNIQKISLLSTEHTAVLWCRFTTSH